MSPEEEIATEKEAERELSAQSPAAPTGMAAGFAMLTLTGNAGPLIAQLELLRAALEQVQELRNKRARQCRKFWRCLIVLEEKRATVALRTR